MVAVFREVRRVLRDDGTLWLNLGDSYAGNMSRASSNGRAGFGTPREGIFNRGGEGLKDKDLIGIPWMVAFALRADGWYLRQDIIWHKPNPMPESVTDRCTKAHEYVFLMSKSARYYYDAEAVKEAVMHPQKLHKSTSKSPAQEFAYHGNAPTNLGRCGTDPSGRNRRSVWTVATQPFKEDHFAVFPPNLIKPMVLAGCPEGGIILDPFMGSGTAAVVARSLGRHFVGIELNEKYKQMAERRVAETTPSLFMEVML